MFVSNGSLQDSHGGFAIHWPATGLLLDKAELRDCFRVANSDHIETPGLFPMVNTPGFTFKYYWWWGVSYPVSYRDWPSIRRAVITDFEVTNFFTEL